MSGETPCLEDVHKKEKNEVLQNTPSENGITERHFEKMEKETEKETEKNGNGNLIVVGNGVPDDWEFRKGIEKTTGEKWDVLQCVTNRDDGINRILRYVRYFTVPFGIFLKGRNLKRVVSWDQFFCLVLAFYASVFRPAHFPKLYTMAFIYIPKKGLKGRIYRQFVKRCVTSPYMTGISVYGKSEIPYYAKEFGIGEERCFPVRLGMTDVSRDYLRVTGKGEYFVSAGRSNRDYAFLKEAWKREYGRLMIICDRMSEADNTPGMEEKDIRVYSDCHCEEYLCTLAMSKACVISLEDGEVSSGQLVLIQSAMFGKPVICTHNSTLRDYIEDGKTGFVIEKTPEALHEALEKLEDESTYERMSRAAREKFENDFSLTGLGMKTGKKILEVERNRERQAEREGKQWLWKIRKEECRETAGGSRILTRSR